MALKIPSLIYLTVTEWNVDETSQIKFQGTLNFLTSLQIKRNMNDTSGSDTPVVLFRVVRCKESCEEADKILLISKCGITFHSPKSPKELNELKVGK